MVLGMNWVWVGRFDAIDPGSGAYGFWEAFESPPGFQNGPEKIKNSKKNKRNQKTRKFQKIPYSAALFFQVGPPYFPCLGSAAGHLGTLGGHLRVTLMCNTLPHASYVHHEHLEEIVYPPKGQRPGSMDNADS